MKELLEKLRSGQSLTGDELRQLEEAGYLQEASWVEEATRTSYRDLVHEFGLDDEDGEHVDPD